MSHEWVRAGSLRSTHARFACTRCGGTILRLRVDGLATPLPDPQQKVHMPLGFRLKYGALTEYVTCDEYLAIVVMES